MTDEIEIDRLQREYALRFDARDAEGFAALFTADAEVVLPGGYRLLDGNKLRKAVTNMPPGGKHLPEPGQITVAGDTATATSRFRFVPGEGPEMTGTYEDRFTRTAQGWRFSFRCTVVDSSGD